MKHDLNHIVPSPQKALFLARRQLPELVCDAINLPAKKQQQFNQLMLAFYQSGDTADMTAFMKSCLDPRIIQIMPEPQ